MIQLEAKKFLPFVPAAFLRAEIECLQGVNAVGMVWPLKKGIAQGMAKWSLLVSEYKSERAEGDGCVLEMTVGKFPEGWAADAPRLQGGSAAARRQAEQVPLRVAVHVHA